MGDLLDFKDGKLKRLKSQKLILGRAALETCRLSGHGFLSFHG